MKRIEVNLKTREIKQLDLTPEEIADLPSEKQKAGELKQHLINVRLAYLRESAIRYMPNFPQDVIAKRDLANQEINDIEACTTLEELNNFTEEFN